MFNIDTTGVITPAGTWPATGTPDHGGGLAAVREDTQAGGGRLGSMPSPTCVPRVIGLDMSLTCTGVAGNGWTDTIKPINKVRGHERLAVILDRVGDFVFHADLVVIEGPAYGAQRAGIQKGHHERAGLWWLVTHKLWSCHVPFAVADPTSVKRYATGKGNADKAAVIREVTRRFEWFSGGEDEADALALAAMGADWLGHPIVDLPKTHRAALDAVRWPEVTRA